MGARSRTKKKKKKIIITTSMYIVCHTKAITRIWVHQCSRTQGKLKHTHISTGVIGVSSALFLLISIRRAYAHKGIFSYTLIYDICLNALQPSFKYLPLRQFITLMCWFVCQNCWFGSLTGCTRPETALACYRHISISNILFSFLLCSNTTHLMYSSSLLFVLLLTTTFVVASEYKWVGFNF